MEIFTLSFMTIHLLTLIVIYRKLNNPEFLEDNPGYQRMKKSSIRNHLIIKFISTIPFAFIFNLTGITEPREIIVPLSLLRIINFRPIIQYFRKIVRIRMRWLYIINIL
jgi:hypothetical protein|mmetsp:Transcript_3664/g.492  ORF Transcript_3664/g.492 Transcript_3664/m.492 type:complete len:109 (-) Transcript_3664:1232-1558(-)